MGEGMIERLGRYIPLQSVKIVVVAWKILTQVSLIGVNWHNSYTRY